MASLVTERASENFVSTIFNNAIRTTDIEVGIRAKAFDRREEKNIAQD